MIALVATGGTIASRATPDGLVAGVSGAGLLAALGTDRAAPHATDARVVDVGVRGSYALTLDDMLTITQVALQQCAAGVEGVVLTHGTDSIEETSFLLDLLHEDETPIVVTGAQRAFDAPDGDGMDNLAMALRCAGSAELRGKGVLVAFGGHVLPARGVRKTQTTELVAFANRSQPTLDDAVRSTLPGAADALAGAGMPAVEVVAAVPGGTGAGMRDATRRRPAGIVFQALGIGNASIEDGAAVNDAVAAGIPVLVTTRVQHGVVKPVYGNGGGKGLEQAGAIFAGDLSTWQARVLLSVCLAVAPQEGAKQTVVTWLSEHATG